MELSTAAGTHCWEMEASLDDFPFLADHRVRGAVVFPAAAYLEMALTASPQGLENVALQEAMFVPASGSRTVQLVARASDPGNSSFSISSRADTGAWTSHVTGTMCTIDAEGAASPSSLDEIRARCTQPVTSAEHYDALAARGLEYGPAFRGITAIQRRDGEAIAHLRLPASAASSVDFSIHPALLDAALQTLAATMPAGDATYVPIAFESVRLYARPSPEMWAHAQRRNEQEGDIRLLDVDGTVVLEALGIRVEQLQGEAAQRSQLSEWLYQLEWAPAPDAAPASSHGAWLLIGDRNGVAESLAPLLPGAVIAPRHADVRRLLDTPYRGIVHLGSLDCMRVDDSAGLCAEIVALVQTIAQAGLRDAPRLYLVTRGAQTLGNVSQAPVWGLGRAIAHEHSELQCSCIDLSADTPVDMLAREILAGDREDQIVYRGHQRSVARLRRARLDDVAELLSPAGNRGFALEMDTPGILDGLKLRAVERRAPGPGEVEIEVHAAGLNFLDVLAAMGLRPDVSAGDPIRLGGECAGVVTATGDGVDEFAVGDSVVALAAGAFRRFVLTPATFVVPKPDGLTFEEAATIPIAFMTAQYALEHLGRLTAGERVLIHSAAGGVGLAAVQIAQRIGAEIYATAGSTEKRAFLESLGIGHIFDSRSLAFAGEILECTGGQGVDVVLNSLAGEAIAASLRALAPYGRFLEIGKRDIYQNSQLGLAPFRKNLSYFAIDLARMMTERPGTMRSLLQNAMRTAQPLRHLSYTAQNAAAAFRDMAQAKHIGKLVLTMQHPEAPIAQAPARVRADATYLITGGLGGLGLTIAQWLVDRGARHMVLLGRGSGSAQARGAIEALDAEVVTMQADVADRDQMARVLERIDRTLPPLAGIVHAAGVLDDGLLLSLTPERVRAVMAPKVQGAWNLHTLTLGRSLDFFVLFSSAAAWLGSPGQSNYAAGNAFLDALARERHTAGLPALSINWGPWSEVGLAAAEENRGARLAFRGVTSFTPQQGADAFGQLLSFGGSQIGVMALNVRQWRQSYAKAAGMPLLAELMQAEEEGATAGASGTSVRAALIAAEPGQRIGLLESHVREQLGQVLRLAPSRIDARTPFRSLGIDSLMALELRNRLESSLGLTLSATLVWNYPTITALAPFLADTLRLPVEAAVEIVAEPVAMEDELDNLSESEMAELLAQELQALAQRSSS